jgi:hypothetical protein
VRLRKRFLTVLCGVLLLGVVSTPLADELSSALAGATNEWHASNQHYEVFLTAPVHAGSVGWCLVQTTSNGGGFACPVTLTPRRPILNESWGGSGPPPVSHGLILTSNEVAAVAINGGIPIPTRTEPGLLYGLRTVLLEADRASLTELFGHGLPQLTPLNTSGQTLTQPTTRPRPTGYDLQTSSWKRPGHPKQGACALSATHVRGLTARWGRVLRRIHAIRGLAGRPFLSCADTEYFLQSWPLDVGIVLDATDPGVPPAPLPLMKPAAGHPEYYQAPGGNGKVLARRIHGAWLLVEGGNGLAQRFVVLSHIRATIHL